MDDFQENSIRMHAHARNRNSFNQTEDLFLEKYQEFVMRNRRLAHKIDTSFAKVNIALEKEIGLNIFAIIDEINKDLEMIFSKKEKKKPLKPVRTFISFTNCFLSVVKLKNSLVTGRHTSTDP
ncbi:hypothetical protein IIC38_11790 [candidate division KSB1 bacterium]|nr:hypothetical protein [candidate division KSB1 bacterium]